MKRLIVTLLVCLGALPLWGRQAARGYCQQGGQYVQMNGLGQSISQFMGSYPGCTVTVFIAGTGTLATLYSDSGGTPKSNPFTADATSGYWFWFGDNGVYDVQLTGGGLPAPITLGSFLLADPNGLTSITLNGNTITMAPGTATVTIPNTTDTLVNLASAQTLQNKTLSGGSLNNAPVGNTTPSTGAFTTLSATSVAATTGTVTTMTSTTTNTQKISTVRYADQFPGADLGAQINAAFADCTNCKVIAPSGTISTDVIIPISSELDFLPNGIYIMSAHLYLYHRGSTLNGGGAYLRCTLDDGTQCIQIGKNNSGTVNTSGTAITWASGTTFSNIDAGDVMNINAAAYNVASVTDSTHLTVTATAGTQTGVSYGVYVNPERNFGFSPNGISVRNLILVHSGGVTTATMGISCYFNTGALLDNVRVQNFTNSGSYAYYSSGCISAELYSYNSNVNGLDFRLDIGTSGGVAYGSNDNKIYGGSTTVTGGSVINISSLNKIYGHRWEDNTGVYGLSLQGSQFGNVCFGCYFETNGDGTTGSADYVSTGGPNWIYGSYFVSGSANHANQAIVSNGASAETYVGNTYITGSYTNAIVAAGGGKNHRMGGVHITGATSGLSAPDIGETGTSTLGVTTAPNFVSNVATGTQPYATTSTTVNTNLNADTVDGVHGADISPVWLSGGTQLPSGHITVGSCTLGTSCGPATLTGSSAFTSAGTFSCAAVDTTSAAAVKLVKTSGTQLTITGTGTDTILFICAGN